MIPEDPQVARPRGRLVGRPGHLVGITKAVLIAEQLCQLVLVEAEQAEVVVHALQLGQLDGEQVVIPIRNVGRLVVANAVGLDLLGRQIFGDVNRNFLQAEFK